MSMDKGRPLPKFGEWDVNDPASAEGFTVIFNKARDERKTGGNTPGPDSPGKDGVAFKHGAYAATKPNSVSQIISSSVKPLGPAPLLSSLRDSNPSFLRNGFAASKQVERRPEDPKP